MRINLAKSAGFCFGVKRAIDIAYKTLRLNKNVYMLGNIVHNEDVARRLEKAGIKRINKLARGKNKVFLIRAHGAGLYVVNKAKALGYSVVDATCPMVKGIHKIACDAEARGYKIIIIGDKKHDEVRGVIGRLKKRAIVIEDAGNIPWGNLKMTHKACIVAQSTQDLEKALKIFRILKPRIKELKFFNTICRPTRLKQREMKSMPLENEAVIIIGSKTSANTKRLYEISKSLNKRSYWVQSKDDLRPAWFKGINSVGVTAGASTPDCTTREVINYIKKWKS
jgi:4-hydroxy-3-methylbut-2-enyl diphosphate reductase